MRGGWFGAVLLALISSCGIETVPSLNPPDVNYLDPLNTNKSLSFVHDSSRYSGSDFVGYQVFYKIYPVSSILDFTRLLADRNSVTANSPVSQLLGMGYQSLSVSSTVDASSAVLEPLLVQNLANSDTVTLDFSAFLDSPGDYSLHPKLLVNGTAPAKANLFRTQNLLTSATRTFASLKKDPLTKTSLPLDISSATTQLELNNQEFEINIFIAAYGITASLVEVSSSPVPWGVIRTIKP